MPSFLDKLPEVFVSDKAMSSQVSQAMRQGKLRKIGSRLYTKDMERDPDQIVLQNWYFLVKDYYPDALIADRTALENKPAKDGSVFIISAKKRETRLPGLVIKPRSGAEALESDRPFLGDLRLSSIPRAYLENMRVSRSRAGSVTRTLSKDEMERSLDQKLRRGGEQALNDIRDNARNIAAQLDLADEFKSLDELIGALLSTRDAKLSSEIGQARGRGKPYDPERLELFLKLFEELNVQAPTRCIPIDAGTKGQTNLAFFEAYFSNFIEGTEFGFDEAVDIVFGGRIPNERPEDAHDVLGTYRIVSDIGEMSRIADDFIGFSEALKARHFSVMEMRADKLPGQFKQKRNQAGAAQFVTPDLVEGTLEKGFEIYRGLDAAMHRAIFMMFLVSEVHPFADGNGRIARIMMNSELVASGEQKIIIPSVYRSNYLSSLKALTHNAQCQPLIRTLEFAQKYTRSIDWSELDIARQQLESTNAFHNPNEADELGIRLKLYDG